MSNGAEMKFICELNCNPAVETAFQELRSFQKHHEEQSKFLTKQMKTLEDQRDAHWRALFTAAQASGKIPPDYKYESWAIHLGDGMKQMFIYEASKGPQGIGALIKSILT